MEPLAVSLSGVKFRNPVLLASGIWGESGKSLLRAHGDGAGDVITKSIGTLARTGYPNPTVEKLGTWGLLNAMGLPNPGVDSYQGEVEEAVKGGATVVGSVFGGDPEEFSTLSHRMEAFGVVAIELNLSCPHAKGYGSEIGADPEMLCEILRTVKRSVTIPVWAKLTPNTANIGALAVAAVKGGADAISAINTVRSLAIDTINMRPILSHGLGGLSGPAIKPVGLACIWQIFERVKVPLIGIGGIATAEDALEYILAGATMVEVGTAIAERGGAVFQDITSGLSTLLKARGFGSLGEAVGAAHRR